MKTQHAFIIVVEGLEEDAIIDLQASLAQIGPVSGTSFLSAPAAVHEYSSASCPRVAKLPKLTQRQLDILPYVLNGLSNKRIARALGLSPFTVRNHITNLFVAFGISGRHNLRLTWSRLSEIELKLAA
jgi:DNA-binding NarL/FixJ family response regulator